MGITIGGLWLGSFLVAAVLFGCGTGDRARTWAVRLGATLSLIGLALGGLMLVPSQAQLAAGGDILGAHAVGVPDGGAGLQLLGWSTTGGDLRVPHFVGMHVQVVPLLALGLEVLARRSGSGRLRLPSTRLALVWIGAVGYAGLIGLVSWQALRGQSVVHPNALTLLAGGALLLGVGGRAVVVVARSRRPADTGSLQPPDTHRAVRADRRDRVHLPVDGALRRRDCRRQGDGRVVSLCSPRSLRALRRR